MAEISKEKFKIVGCKGIGIEEEFKLDERNYFKHSIKRFLHNKASVAALIIIVIVVAISIVGPNITDYKYDIENKLLRNKFPSSEHIFGTDYLGRDIFVRVCMSVRTSLFIGIIVAFINITIGIIYGGICAYYGGFIDDIIMRIIEILTSVPNLIFIIQILLVLRVGIISLIIAMSLVGWCNIGRIMRGQFLQIKEHEYILAAQALGASTSRIMSKHFLINILNIAIVTLTLEVPSVILNEASLSFIGFGVPEPYISFGILTVESIKNLMFYPYQILIPGLFISLILICLNILGDGLADALDYRIGY